VKRKPLTTTAAFYIFLKRQKPAIITRSQAVTRIADRTASRHLWGHVTSSVTWPFDIP